MTPANRSSGGGGRGGPLPIVGFRTGRGVLGFPPPAGPDATTAVFAALSDPTRRALLEALSRDGETTATHLAESFPITRQAIVKHLGMLTDAGLVSGQRVGREQRFRLEAAALEPAVVWMSEVGAAWDKRLAALRRHLSRRP